jgi:pimeloyl-ACP methyl ester carboxylesterase
MGCTTPGEQGDPKYTFDPVLVSTFQLATETEAGPEDWVAPFLAPGESYTVELYEVPGFPCARMGTDDLSELPDHAQTPGDPAVFVIIHPDSATGIDRGVMFYPHGYGNEGLERATVTLYNEDRAVYDSLENFQPELTEIFVGQTTAEGGRALVRVKMTEDMTVAFLRRGWTIVSPANCWGDLGIGTGRIIDGLYRARRWTRVFDREVIEFARGQHARPESLYAFGCSGGGARLTQQLLQEPHLFRAVVYDSPADNPASLVSEPLPSMFAMLDLVTEGAILVGAAQYLVDFYGSIEGTREYSLGYRLGVDIDLNDVPILLGYVTEDPMLHNDAFVPLAEALQDPARYSNADSEVWRYESNEHCPFEDMPDQRPMMLDWFERFAD